MQEPSPDCRHARQSRLQMLWTVFLHLHARFEPILHLAMSLLLVAQADIQAFECLLTDKWSVIVLRIMYGACNITFTYCGSLVNRNCGLRVLKHQKVFILQYAENGFRESSVSAVPKVLLNTNLSHLHVACADKLDGGGGAGRPSLLLVCDHHRHPEEIVLAGRCQHKGRERADNECARA